MACPKSWTGLDRTLDWTLDSGLTLKKITPESPEPPPPLPPRPSFNFCRKRESNNVFYGWTCIRNIDEPKNYFTSLAYELNFYPVYLLTVCALWLTADKGSHMSLNSFSYLISMRRRVVTLLEKHSSLARDNIRSPKQHYTVALTPSNAVWFLNAQFSETHACSVYYLRLSGLFLKLGNILFFRCILFFNLS